MLLTITTTHRPATDIGYLLGKNPNRRQSFSIAFGQAQFSTRRLKKSNARRLSCWTSILSLLSEGVAALLEMQVCLVSMLTTDHTLRPRF